MSFAKLEFIRKLNSLNKYQQIVFEEPTGKVIISIGWFRFRFTL